MVPLLAALVCPGSLLKLEPDLAACSTRPRTPSAELVSHDWLWGYEQQDWHSMQLLRRRASSLTPLHLPRMLQIQPCRKGRPCLTCAERPPASAVNPALQGDAQTPSSIKAGTPCQGAACQCAAVQLRPAVATLLNPAAAAQRFWQPRHRAALTFLSPQSSQSSLLLLLLAAPRPLRLCELPLRAAMPPVGGRRLPALLLLGGGTE